MKRMIDKSLDFEIILFPYMHPPYGRTPRNRPGCPKDWLEWTH